MHRVRTFAALAAVAVLAVACSSDGDDDEVVTDTTAAASTTSSATASSSATTAPDVTVDDGGIDPLDDASREDRHGGDPEARVNYVTDVRIGRHEGYDRFVLELRDEQMPEWWVSVAEGPLSGDPSGEPIALEGTSRLDVRVYPASGVEFTDEDPGYVEIYTGPDRVPGTAATMAEAVLVGDFEANLLWAIGLRDPVDFRVLELTDPTRLVIDVRNH